MNKAIELLIQARSEARKQKDFQLADDIRRILEQRGVTDPKPYLRSE